MKVPRYDHPVVPPALFAAEDLAVVEKYDGSSFRFALYDERYEAAYPGRMAEAADGDGSLVFGTRRTVPALVGFDVLPFDAIEAMTPPGNPYEESFDGSLAIADALDVFERIRIEDAPRPDRSCPPRCSADPTGPSIRGRTPSPRHPCRTTSAPRVWCSGATIWAPGRRSSATRPRS